MVQFGWSKEDALMFQSLSWPTPRVAIAYGLRNGDSTFSACTYAICEAIYRQAEKQREGADLPMKLYRHLHGRYSLSEADPSWNSVEQPDCTGFRGLTSAVLVKARGSARESPPSGTCSVTKAPFALFSKDGFNQWTHEHGPQVQDSDVVCFESQPSCDQGLHAAVMTEDETHGVFPPNTLFTLKGIKEAGEWESPNGIKVDQRLLVVTATFRPPHSNEVAKNGSKMCGSVTTLSYGDRKAYITGLHDILEIPALTLVLEFDRDLSWVDWRGREYSLRDEYAYVIGPAKHMHIDEVIKMGSCPKTLRSLRGRRC
jgi:hypothetical protein